MLRQSEINDEFYDFYVASSQVDNKPFYDFMIILFQNL